MASPKNLWIIFIKWSFVIKLMPHQMHTCVCCALFMSGWKTSAIRKVRCGSFTPVEFRELAAMIVNYLSWSIPVTSWVCLTLKIPWELSWSCWGLETWGTIDRLSWAATPHLWLYSLWGSDMNAHALNGIWRMKSVAARKLHCLVKRERCSWLVVPTYNLAIKRYQKLVSSS